MFKGTDVALTMVSSGYEPWDTFYSAFRHSSSLRSVLGGTVRPFLSSIVDSKVPLSICTRLDVENIREVPTQEIVEWLLKGRIRKGSPSELNIFTPTSECANLIRTLVNNSASMPRDPDWSVLIRLYGTFSPISDYRARQEVAFQLTQGTEFRRYITYEW